MLEPKRIHVTTAQIKLGKRNSSTSCPIALALHRAYPHLPFDVGSLAFEVGSLAITVFFLRSLTTEIHPLPAHITEWINRYDTAQNVKPLKFTFPFEEPTCPRSPNP